MATQKEKLGCIDVAHEHQKSVGKACAFYNDSVMKLNLPRGSSVESTQTRGTTSRTSRLVAAELERRWEESLRELKQAEETIKEHQQQIERPMELSDELKEAFSARCTASRASRRASAKTLGAVEKRAPKSTSPVSY